MLLSSRSPRDLWEQTDWMRQCLEVLLPLSFCLRGVTCSRFQESWPRGSFFRLVAMVMGDDVLFLQRAHKAGSGPLPPCAAPSLEAFFYAAFLQGGGIKYRPW